MMFSLFLLSLLLLLLLLTLWPLQVTAAAATAAPSLAPTPAPSLASGPNPWYGSQSNNILYNGKYYSLLSNALIDSTAMLCQNTNIALPNFWKVAPDNAGTRTLIGQHYWSTAFVLLSNGVGIRGLYGTSLAGTLFGTGPYLVQSGSSYYSSSCNAQVNSPSYNTY
jgi:hypothetical protein